MAGIIQLEDDGLEEKNEGEASTQDVPPAVSGEPKSMY
jgi:hypothetical protein